MIFRLFAKNTFYFDLKQLKKFAEQLSKKIKNNEILLLKGELGSGKTTFAKYFINEIYNKMKIKPPKFIKSPTFQILNTYNFKDLNINHYDLYRIKKINEIDQIGLFENLYNCITLIEWPEILMKKMQKYNYYEIKFSFLDYKNRKVVFNKNFKDIV